MRKVFKVVALSLGIFSLSLFTLQADNVIAEDCPEGWTTEECENKKQNDKLVQQAIGSFKPAVDKVNQGLKDGAKGMCMYTEKPKDPSTVVFPKAEDVARCELGNTYDNSTGKDLIENKHIFGDTPPTPYQKLICTNPKAMKECIAERGIEREYYTLPEKIVIYKRQLVEEVVQKNEQVEKDDFILPHEYKDKLPEEQLPIVESILSNLSKVKNPSMSKMDRIEIVKGNNRQEGTGSDYYLKYTVVNPQYWKALRPTSKHPRPGCNDKIYYKKPHMNWIFPTGGLGLSPDYYYEKNPDCSDYVEHNTEGFSTGPKVYIKNDKNKEGFDIRKESVALLYLAGNAKKEDSNTANNYSIDVYDLDKNPEYRIGCKIQYGTTFNSYPLHARLWESQRHKFNDCFFDVLNIQCQGKTWYWDLDSISDDDKNGIYSKTCYLVDNETYGKELTFPMNNKIKATNWGYKKKGTELYNPIFMNEFYYNIQKKINEYVDAYKVSDPSAVLISASIEDKTDHVEVSIQIMRNVPGNPIANTYTCPIPELQKDPCIKQGNKYYCSETSCITEPVPLDENGNPQIETFDPEGDVLDNSTDTIDFINKDNCTVDPEKMTIGDGKYMKARIPNFPADNDCYGKDPKLINQLNEEKNKKNRDDIMTGGDKAENDESWLPPSFKFTLRLFQSIAGWMTGGECTNEEKRLLLYRTSISSKDLERNSGRDIKEGNAKPFLWKIGENELENDTRADGNCVALSYYCSFHEKGLGCNRLLGTDHYFYIKNCRRKSIGFCCFPDLFMKAIAVAAREQFPELYNWGDGVTSPGVNPCDPDVKKINHNCKGVKLSDFSLLNFNTKQFNRDIEAMVNKEMEKALENSDETLETLKEKNLVKE